MELRQKAWDDLMTSEAFRAFRAADNMVVDLGGQSAMPSTAPSIAPRAVNPRPRLRAIDGSSRLSQGDAGVKALKEAGHPLHINALTNRSKAMGAMIGGGNPVANFRSTLSKDERFYSFRHNGDYWWWLTGVPLPQGWEEAADDLPFDTAASDSSNQEGGESHAATTT
jgi:hypothetical protein